MPDEDIATAEASAIGRKLIEVLGEAAVRTGHLGRGEKAVVSRLMWKSAMAPLPDAAFRLCSTTRYAAASSSWAMTSTIFS